MGSQATAQFWRTCVVSATGRKGAMLSNFASLTSRKRTAFALGGEATELDSAGAYGAGVGNRPCPSSIWRGDER
jgi:hypothetical protein